MRKSTKLRDIAQNTGVSQSTVSKAFNNATDINSKTRERILHAAVKLGYSAQIPIVKSIKTIGIICPEIKSNYYAQIITAIEAGISKHDYKMTIAFTDFLHENERKILNDFVSCDIAGIILLTENSDNSDIKNELIGMKENMGVPVVFVTVNQKIDEFDTFLIDEAAGVRMIVDHLVGLGHTNIGFISDKFTINRLENFKSEMKRKELKINENNIYVEKSGRRFEECGYAGASALFDFCRKENMPTAIIAGYDDIAVGAMRLFSERKLYVPEDISIAGIDNISISPYMPVSLTTVAVPVEELGDLATQILLRKIREPNYILIQQVILRPRLIIRESTCPNKQAAGENTKIGNTKNE